MFRPSVDELADSSTLATNVVVDDYALNHYEPGLHAPIDDLPIHQVPGNRIYPSVMMDSDIGPGHMDAMNTTLTVGNIAVHTTSTGKETTLNPGDGLGLDDEGLKAVNQRTVRVADDKIYQPDVIVPPGNADMMRRIFNTFDPNDPVSSFPMLYNNIGGTRKRVRYMPQIDAGGKVPAIGISSILDQFSAGLDADIPPTTLKAPKSAVQTVKIQKE